MSGEETTTGGWRTLIRAVAINRAFGLFSLGAFPSALGGWIQQVALGWVVAVVGGSSLWLGLLSFSSMGPLILAPLGGTLADRVERRLLIMVCSAVQALAAIALAVLALTGRLSLAGLLVLALMSGLPNAVMWPAWSAFVSDLVGPADLRRAVAVNSGRFNLTRVVGPAVAGLLLTRGGPTPCLVAAALCSCSLVVTLFFVRPAHTRPRPPAASWSAALREAAHFAARTPRVRAQLFSAGALGLLALPYAALLPGFASQVFHGGPQALTWLVTCGGIGAVGGAVVSGTPLASVRPYLTAAVLHIATGLGVAALAVAPSLPWACAATAAIGASSVVYLVVVNATLQLDTPPDLVGRLLGLWVVVNAGTVPVGGLVLGALASVAGLRPVELVAGLLSLLGVGILLRLISRPADLIPSSLQDQQRTVHEAGRSASRAGL